MKKTLILICSFLQLGLFAQSMQKSVISTAGGTLENSSNQLVFTIGEPNIGEMQNGAIISVGFLASVSETEILGVEEALSSKQIQYYPNPVVDQLNIELWENEEYKIYIYSSSGKLLKEQFIKGKKAQVNISNLTSAAYLVRIVNQENHKTYTFKIIKK